MKLTTKKVKPQSDVPNLIKMRHIETKIIADVNIKEARAYAANGWRTLREAEHAADSRNGQPST